MSEYKSDTWLYYTILLKCKDLKKFKKITNCNVWTVFGFWLEQFFETI